VGLKSGCMGEVQCSGGLVCGVGVVSGDANVRARVVGGVNE
jgi:hypothetical protein